MLELLFLLEDEVVSSVDLADFLDEEPAFTFVVDDFDVEPVVLLPLEVLLFGVVPDEVEEDELLGLVELLLLLSVPILVLPDILLDEDDVGLVLLDELLDRLDDCPWF
ncbi:hypothetical protein [Pontibacter oryzae]|uniref:hypothetical protein n=1 Tax=Pontibacter oryzae TaxID=2304593 RepID=UPI0011C38280|nr:hypothetical protein [Pontibacter oryzae]